MIKKYSYATRYRFPKSTTYENVLIIEIRLFNLLIYKAYYGIR